LAFYNEKLIEAKIIYKLKFKRMLS